MTGRRAGKLSGGERKMLAMGRALMLEPALVVLDEPTANLAPIIAGTVLHEHVRQLAATGASVLIVEQRARAVLEISDRTYVLGGGQLRMEGARRGADRVSQTRSSSIPSSAALPSAPERSAPRGCGSCPPRPTARSTRPSGPAAGFPSCHTGITALLVAPTEQIRLTIIT